MSWKFHTDIPPAVRERIQAAVRRHEGPEVAAEVLPVAGDGGARQYVRLLYSGRTTIVAVLPQQTGEEVGSRGGHERFGQLARLLATHQIRVPKIYWFDAELALYCQEDLGHHTLAQYCTTASPAERLAFYQKSLQQLYRVSKVHVPAGIPVMNREIVDFEFRHYLEEIFLHRGVHCQEQDLQRVQQFFGRLSEEIAALPRCFSLRDLQSRNIMCLPDQSVVLIDFQDAWMAPYPYDLISLSRDASLPLSDTDIAWLEQTWVAEAPALPAARNYSRDIDLVAAHRNLKDAGRFAYFDRINGKDGYLQWIPRIERLALEALQRIEPEEGAWFSEWVRGHSPFPPDTESRPDYVQVTSC